MVCVVVLMIAFLIVGVLAIIELDATRRNETVVLPALIRQLEEAPLDAAIHAAFLRALRSLKLPGTVTAGKPAYDAALRVLEDNPGECRSKQLVLEVGRWHFGRGRPGGAPTIYDEQALLNDILVRSQTTAFPGTQSLVHTFDRN